MRTGPEEHLRLFVVGPTASGKSDFAMVLARALHGEIINADARQFYRDACIGTAAPGAEERRTVPHHLYTFLPPTERVSAGSFVAWAEACITEIQARGALPIIVGGTGLYFRALRYGLVPVPVAPEVRHQLRDRLAREGPPAMRAWLQTVDPEAARRIAPGDTRRILRALEIYLATGEPASRWWNRHRWGQPRSHDLCLGLLPPRAALYARIRERTRNMWARGWKEEVQRLLDRGVPRHAPVFEAIGYRTIAEWLHQPRITETDLVEQLVRQTCAYARRQIKWFRREPDVLWFQNTPPLARVQDLVDLRRT